MPTRLQRKTSPKRRYAGPASVRKFGPICPIKTVFEKFRTEFQNLGLVTVALIAQKDIPPHWATIS